MAETPLLEARVVRLIIGGTIYPTADYMICFRTFYLQTSGSFGSKNNQFLKRLDNLIKNRYIFSKFKGIF